MTLPAEFHTLRRVAVVLIPVKASGHAKQRLSALLSQAERTQLAWAMLCDLSRALERAVLPRAVFVVTSSTPVERFARRQGWDVLREKSQSSESSSVDWGCAQLKARGFGQVLRLPGDIPLVTGSDVDSVIEAGLAAGSSVIVPSLDGTGTNALLRTPPDAFPSRFGPGSFHLHQEEAASRGVPLLTLPNEHMALDIDVPDDLLAFLNRSAPCRTLDFLVSIGVRSRLEDATA